MFRRSLEAKAALYERLRRGEGLKELDKADEEGGASGEGPTYMVDFTKKVYEVGTGVCACVTQSVLIRGVASF